MPDEALPHLLVQRTFDEMVCVVFHEDKVRAVVVREPHHAATERGLKVGDKNGRVMEVYPEESSQDITGLEVPGPKNTKRKIEVRRYDALGIGFEMHLGKVTAIALYPPVNNP